MFVGLNVFHSLSELKDSLLWELAVKEVFKLRKKKKPQQEPAYVMNQEHDVKQRGTR